jgi:hypothetical protein
MTSHQMAHELSPLYRRVSEKHKETLSACQKKQDINCNELREWLESLMFDIDILTQKVLEDSDGYQGQGCARRMSSV